MKFLKLVDGGPAPQRATQSAFGSLPTDGFRYCEPVRSASAHGWYVFLPMDVWIRFDGSEMFWSLDEGDHWDPLSDAIQYPYFSQNFDKAAPDNCKGYSPPFLTRTNDIDILQIWTGCIARTEPGLASYVRGTVNYTYSRHYSVLEGVIETADWFGPLFANIRIHTQNSPIILRSHLPFLQVQPIALDTLKSVKDPDVAVGLDAMEESDWAAFKDTVVRRMETRTRLGDYAVETRKRAKERAREAAQDKSD